MWPIFCWQSSSPAPQLIVALALARQFHAPALDGRPQHSITLETYPVMVCGRLMPASSWLASVSAAATPWCRRKPAHLCRSGYSGFTVMPCRRTAAPPARQHAADSPAYLRLRRQNRGWAVCRCSMIFSMAGRTAAT